MLSISVHAHNFKPRRYNVTQGNFVRRSPLSKMHVGGRNWEDTLGVM